jgi:predicted RNase H-like HicB family nuclease
MKKSHVFTAVVNKRGDRYNASCLDLPADGYGNTVESAIDSLKHEIAPYLNESLPQCIRYSVLTLEVAAAYHNSPLQTYPFTAIIWPDGDWFVALNAEVGVASQGETFEHAVTMIKEATQLYLKEMPNPNYGHPQIITFEFEASTHELAHA